MMTREELKLDKEHFDRTSAIYIRALVDSHLECLDALDAANHEINVRDRAIRGLHETMWFDEERTTLEEQIENTMRDAREEAKLTEAPHQA